MSVEPIYPEQPFDSLLLFETILHLSKEDGLFEEEGRTRLDKVKHYIKREKNENITNRIFLEWVSLPIKMNISREVGQGRGELPIALLILLKRGYINIPYDPVWHMDNSRIDLTSKGKQTKALDELRDDYNFHDARERRIKESIPLVYLAKWKISAETVEEWNHLARLYLQEGMIRQSELCKEKALEIFFDYYQKLGLQESDESVASIAKDFVDSHYQNVE